MRTTFSTILSLLFAMALWTGCAEDISVKLPNASGKIVIEGKIENGTFAEVIITRNIPLFSSNAGATLNDFFVFDAQVYVTAGGITDTLQLGIDSASALGIIYKGSTITGVAGGTYQLKVIADGKTYIAVTTIPQPLALDSVFWKPEPGSGDSLGFSWGKMSEPAGLGHNYRFYAKKPSHRRFLPPFGATFDDLYIDGKTFEFGYTRPYDPTDAEDTWDNDDETTRGYYGPDDTIYIKFCTMDRASKDFYATFENALASNGNPFTSPTTILGNITGGALGVWAGFGVTYDTIMPTP